MRVLTVVLTAVLGAACATGTAGGDTASSGYTLGPDEWSVTSATNVLEAIVLLRPSWIGSRVFVEEDRADNCVEVFRNQTNIGGRDSLKSYQLDGIRLIRFIPKGNPRPGDPFASMQQCVGIQLLT